MSEPGSEAGLGRWAGGDVSLTAQTAKLMYAVRAVRGGKNGSKERYAKAMVWMTWVKRGIEDARAGEAAQAEQDSFQVEDDGPELAIGWVGSQKAT